MSLADDFARWRDDPMTRRVMEALELAAQAQKKEWDAAAWGGRVVRPEALGELLKELRVRADTLRALSEMTVDDLVSWLELETEADAE